MIVLKKSAAVFFFAQRPYDNWNRLIAMRNWGLYSVVVTKLTKGQLIKRNESGGSTLERLMTFSLPASIPSSLHIHEQCVSFLKCCLFATLCRVNFVTVGSGYREHIWTREQFVLVRFFSNLLAPVHRINRISTRGCVARADYRERIVLERKRHVGPMHVRNGSIQRILMRRP